jgi:hypothetical protein
MFYTCISKHIEKLAKSKGGEGTCAGAVYRDLTAAYRASGSVSRSSGAGTVRSGGRPANRAIRAVNRSRTSVRRRRRPDGGPGEADEGREALMDGLARVHWGGELQ